MVLFDWKYASIEGKVLIAKTSNVKDTGSRHVNFKFCSFLWGICGTLEENLDYLF